mmetsp:Transcript_13243/g.35137  ORF Transcript_13243/g.35137 Transcript_13243/m.35137 type:complete len:200 (-) Transcript_13243:275-874(-)
MLAKPRWAMRARLSANAWCASSAAARSPTAPPCTVGKKGTKEAKPLPAAKRPSTTGRPGSEGASAEPARRIVTCGPSSRGACALIVPRRVGAPQSLSVPVDSQGRDTSSCCICCNFFNWCSHDSRKSFWEVICSSSAASASAEAAPAPPWRTRLATKWARADSAEGRTSATSCCTCFLLSAAMPWSRAAADGVLGALCT